MKKKVELAEKDLKAAIRKASKKAITENRVLGINSTALIKGNLVEIKPDNTVSIIKKALPKSKRLPKIHFKLG